MESQQSPAGVPASAQAVPLVPLLHNKLLLVSPDVARAVHLPRTSLLSQLTFREAGGRKFWKVCYHSPEGVFLGGWTKLVRDPEVLDGPEVHVRNVQRTSIAPGYSV